MDDFFNDILNPDTSNEESDQQRESEKKRLKTIIQKELPRYSKYESLFGVRDPQKLKEIKQLMVKIVDIEGTFLRNYEIDSFLNELIRDITSLGKISSLMDDPDISEIMINSHDEIWIEKNCKLQLTNFKFDSEDELQELAERIARNVGRLIDAVHPSVDARLPDGSRVHIIIPPLARKGVTITIRKFFQEKLEAKDLVNNGTITDQMKTFLERVVVSGNNLIVSGGTGSGKTTMLNILSNFIPDDERIITMEDSAELQLNNEHVVSLETKNANAEGKGAVVMKDLVVNSLRMRPDRIVVGEVRDETAYDLLNAMSTGHEGSMSTIHANNPENCISRLSNLILEKNMGMNTEIVRTLIGEAVDVIVQISKMRDGSRRVENISQIDVDNNGSVMVQPIFTYQIEGFDEDGNLEGAFRRTDNEIFDDIKTKFMNNGFPIDNL